MLSTVRKTIHKYNMLTSGDRVVVGLSGGADSVSLLSVLMALRNELQLTIYAVHINHNLRGEAARQDEGLARALCEDLGVSFFVYQADVRSFADVHRLGIEEAGRKLRYQYLHQAMVELGAQKIVVGHNSDDNAETVLLNLFRGTGLKGLCGIPPVNGVVIRPLLEVSRHEIEAYVDKNSLPFTIDDTNLSIDYKRNAIRNVIMPEIHKHFGNQTAGLIARNALFMRDDEDALVLFSQKKVRMVPYGFSPKIILNVDSLLSHHVAIARRLLRDAISELRGEIGLEDITSAHIESIIDIAQGRTGREISLPGFKARREYENLVLHKDRQTQRFCHILSPDIPVNIPGMTIKLSITPPYYPLYSKYCTHSLNYDKVNMPLEIRTRRPGDKITLPGGTKKLQDYFTDTKTPRALRDSTPLLAHGSDILWIMDKHNRINVAYQAIDGQQACWVTVY
ncbi:MAG: tRNA lysidine(34) synthetase TilS [Defluviitaleaceae bacterium]|nr:tRNA lysidine(34) synthetase TilS [Defluviitaleaceae bacterium]